MSEKEEIARWGILGTGDIAGQFAQDLGLLEEARLQAVGSRSQASADAFGAKHHVPNCHAGYEALAADPDVDIVYIGSPHPWHREHAEMCLRNGKAVLCEKPLALNAAEAESMIQCAKGSGMFLMEAMWTFFFPAVEKALQLVADGAIGDVRSLYAAFSFTIPRDPDFRLFDPELGGGALLDVGVYPVSLAQRLFDGEPAELATMAQMGPTGVDEGNVLTLRYAQDQLAVLQSGSRVSLPQVAVIGGTDGHIELPRFSQPDRVILRRGDHEEQFTFNRIGLGLAFEARHVMQCLREGQTESPIVPWAFSMGVARTMDKARKAWGLRYPSESGSSVPASG